MKLMRPCPGCQAPWPGPPAAMAAGRGPDSGRSRGRAGKVCTSFYRYRLRRSVGDGPSRDRKDRRTRGPGAVVTADRRSPRLKDVAQAAGVHVSTASRALNARTAALLNPATLERVREAADGLGYRVNGMARALTTQRSL